ncbi:MAG: BolA family transcriptional regulator [Proteobacteria bacterium]|nr:BolA family transcriptional regulator [Pseudomonadota bacterium]MBT4357978.1 BolA family transcriptional regulator [Pseudomonadota bacterium]MBT4986507.1 BolA family transcriptional regulator [Pseudomonadota bacterium]MBT5189523.1 BolA family transcriptional regulator [Pseudomonadota bacterium]MBT5626541.1 BolA family transcriptional regulator [Pseudomonadota bacterium]
MSVKDQIHQRLMENLGAESVEIEDQSHLHAGHAGAASGGGHYDVIVISSAFNDLNTLGRHRLIYRAVDDLMKKEIHALSIQAFSPDEV